VKTEKELQEFIKSGNQIYMPGLTIDCVIFGYHDQQLKVLLGRYKGLNGYGLPGGYVKKTELLSVAAKRILKEKTALDNLYLEQFYIFGDTSFRRQKLDIHPSIAKSWLAERTFSIGYYALVEFSKVTPEPDFLVDPYEWHDVNAVQSLLFDHSEMITKALEHLRVNLYHKPIGYNLLEKKFTLPEIQSLYETILEKKLDRRNFPKKLMSLGLIKDTNEVRKIGQHRSPKLYSFDKKNYNTALKEGIVLVL
jgi:ADP-ribose pyrophosphatase YjhB (NUDIX family)